ncbi:MAG: hypothetical protein A2086_00305 [Spirochaetes bacterium GWD1_27_9]|nr:MAG: hypothetical protein A2Z98_09440 [Spirochaetes bacterium GWB1_27_13]OHD43012.1 MAG: hypothetical protein A2086_00305 [Spirochaetes bacterium GWD1_27_9]
MEGQLLKLNELGDIISNEVKNIVSKNSLKAKLVCIVVAEDVASISYIRGMQKQADKLGIAFEIAHFKENITQEEFFEKIEFYNESKDYSGIIIQVPLPKHIDTFKLSYIIEHKKDIDGINPHNQGRLFGGKPFLIPATAWACDITLKYIEKKYNYKLEGKTAVIVGRSLTVGKPTFHLLLQRNITPTIIHTKTINKEQIADKADIIVASCGIPELITVEWIKQDAIVLDVGIHCIECNIDKTFKLCGDVNAKSTLHKASFVTAVPGGIGVVTSALLFANVIKSYYKLNEDREITFEFEK